MGVRGILAKPANRTLAEEGPVSSDIAQRMVEDEEPNQIWRVIRYLLSFGSSTPVFHGEPFFPALSPCGLDGPVFLQAPGVSMSPSQSR